MPELPEVETVVRDLKGILPGACLRTLTITDPRLNTTANGADFLSIHGGCVRSVSRMGKQIVIEFELGVTCVWLSIHLRMTGRLLWVNSHGPGQLVPYYRNIGTTNEKHVRARFEFEEGELLFHDPRRFGTFEIAPSRTQFKPVGIEPLSEEFTDSWLFSQLQGSRQNIKAWLLRQDKVVGLGQHICERDFV